MIYLILYNKFFALRRIHTIVIYCTILPLNEPVVITKHTSKVAQSI